jgi:predicted ATPase
VFVLPPWEDIYESDEARYENFEQAKLIYNHLLETYQNYGYHLIEVPRGTVEERIKYILSQFF